MQIAAAIANQEAITGWTVRALVHTYDPEVADTPEFVAEIDRATGVWFGGVRRNAQALCLFALRPLVVQGCCGAQGRQWRISDAYLGTAAQAAFERVLQRGGVIGGSSAGAAFQGDVMIRGNKEPNDLSILLDPEHLEGFGYATGAGYCLSTESDRIVVTTRARLHRVQAWASTLTTSLAAASTTTLSSASPSLRTSALGSMRTPPW